MNRYLFIIILLMCVIPGVYMTIIDEGDINIDTLIACTFGDGKDLDAMNPLIDKQTTNSMVKDILKSKIDKSSTTSISMQNIVISDPDPSTWSDNPIFKSKIQCRNPGLIGLFGVTTERPAFGCSASINQSINMEISEISQDISEDHEEITQTILSDIKLKASGGKKPEQQSDSEKETNKFIDELKNKLEQFVLERTVILRDKYSGKNQNAVYTDRKIPFACDCDMKGPEISQEANLDMFADELYENVREKIKEQAADAGMDIELEGIPTEPPVGKELLCFFQILACTASMLAIFYLVYSVITNKDIIEEDKQKFAAFAEMKKSKLNSKLAMKQEKFAEGKGLRGEQVRQKTEQAKRDEGKSRFAKFKEGLPGEGNSSRLSLGPVADKKNKLAAAAALEAQTAAEATAKAKAERAAAETAEIRAQTRRTNDLAAAAAKTPAQWAAAAATTSASTGAQTDAQTADAATGP